MYYFEKILCYFWWGRQVGPACYMYESALNLLLCLDRKHNISITHLVGAPDHRKGYIDGLNDVDKHYLKIS